MKEIETKFKIYDPAALRRKIKKIKAEFISKNLEEDIYYCFPGCKNSKMVVRLRTIRKKTGIFTVKLPPKTIKEKTFKTRDEYEIAVKKPLKYNALLEKLGLKKWLLKEKIRETYKLGKSKILLDELPHIGYFCEIEGPKSDIRRISSMLGLSLKNASAQTYKDLFDRYRKKVKRPGLKMVFSR